MIEYILTFINSHIHNRNNDSNNKESSCRKHIPAGCRLGIGASKKTSEYSASKKRTGGFEQCRISCFQKWGQQCKRYRGSLQDSKALRLESRKDSQSSKSFRWQAWTQASNKVIPFSLFIFSNPTYLIILQAIDDICLQINPTLFGALIIK